MQKSSVVQILSIGRSGTSVLTRGLKSLGVTLGEDVLKGELAFNKKGLWEELEVIDLCNQILQSLNTYQWQMDGVGQLDTNKIPLHLRDKALSFIKQNTDKCAIYGFKDCMSWKIIPFWKSIYHELSIRPTYIIAVRNPVNAVDSMIKMRQAGLTLGAKKSAKMYALWLESIVTIMNKTYGENIVVVDYDQLLENPEHQMQRIAKILDINECDIDQTDLQEYLDAFVDRKLRNSDDPLDRIDEEACFPVLMQKSYKLLQDLATDKLSAESVEVKDFFDNCYLQLKNVGPLFRVVNSLEESLLSFNSVLEDALLKSVQLPEQSVTGD